MGSILDRIDAAVDNLCPCGAEPQPGSIYCGDDCRPTHVSRDTDTSGPGTYGAQSTAMRWRPDLVSQVDDGGLSLIIEFRFRRYNARIHASATRVHARLDDGYRWVGADLDIPWNGSTDPTDLPADLREGVDPIWAKLERQLTDSRYSEPDPWAAAWPNAIASFRYRPGDIIHGVDLAPIRQGRAWIAPADTDPNSREGWTEIGGASLTHLAIDEVVIEDLGDGAAAYPTVVRGWGDPDSNPLGDIQLVLQRAEQTYAAAMQNLGEGLSSLQPTFQRLVEEFSSINGEHAAARFVRVAHEEPEERAPDHPMLAAIEARRNRNTGPEQRQRAPRQIGPRRTR